MNIWRFAYTPTATFGVIEIDGRKDILYSLELPWLNNQDTISCIPSGVYDVEPYDSPHLKMRVYRLLDVPGRTDIEIHPANSVTQLEGCIAPGKQLVTEKNWISNSHSAFDLIRDVYGDKIFQLTIGERVWLTSQPAAS